MSYHSAPSLKRKKRIIFLVGPTATGKSAIGVILAKKINAEIISCDSMQIYKGMDILTSMPGPVLRKKVSHHLIRYQSPGREYNVSRYRDQASRKIKEILGRGRVPLFVGGTGHYMSIMLDGIFKAKAQNKALRNRLYKIAEKKGNIFLYRKLKKIDPQSAAKIHPNDTKRIIRALEVFQVTGKPISELQKQRKGLWQDYDVRIFCLNMPREELYQRINKRVNKMFAQGLIREVEKLLKNKLSRTASYAIGLREIKGYLAGAYGLEEAKRLVKRNTRAYAKRQLTWFREDKRIEWIETTCKEKPASVAQRICNII